MSQVSGQTRINAPAEKVWATLADLAAVQNYSPGVAKSYYTSDDKEGVGARRHCDLQNPGGWVEERVTEWDQGNTMTIEIYESNAPLKTAFAHFTLTPGEQETTVDFDIEYQMKFGPIGALMDAIMVRSQFQNSVRSVLAGLKHHVETGEVIGDALPGSTAA